MELELFSGTWLFSNRRLNTKPTIRSSFHTDIKYFPNWTLSMSCGLIQTGLPFNFLGTYLSSPLESKLHQGRLFNIFLPQSKFYIKSVQPTWHQWDSSFLRIWQWAHTSLTGFQRRKTPSTRGVSHLQDHWGRGDWRSPLLLPGPW